MIGSLIGCVTVCVGTAYAYKNNPVVKKELDGVSDWIDRQVDWIFGSDDDKKPEDKKSVHKSKAKAKPKAKPKSAKGTAAKRSPDGRFLKKED